MKEQLIEKILEQYLLWNTEIKKEEESESIFIWKYVLIRCRNAWVHFGKLEYAKNWVYRLSESRRIWYWETNKWISLSELALYGIHSNSKVCDILPLIEIIEKEWWEIFEVKEVDSFKNIEVYNHN